MPICIYCKRWKKTDYFTNREHVMPQAFGHFVPSLIINYKSRKIKRICKVCNDCNNIFSKIERWLAKDSYEGYILRTKYLKKVISSNRRRTKMKILEGEFKGLNIQIHTSDSIDPLPQIGLLNNNGTWDFFLLSEINRIKKEQYKFSKNSLFACQMSDNEAIEIFRKIGIDFQLSIDTPNLVKKMERVNCEIETIIDSTIKRAVAKIAFNYFSYFNSKANILKSNFDDIRNFIIHEKGEHILSITNHPILSDESLSYGRLGHIIVINVDRFGKIIAHVSLFNMLNYKIFMGEKKCLHNLKIGFGNFFNISTKKMEDIGKTSIILPKLNKIILPNEKIWLPK